MPQNLPVSRLISVNVILSALAAQGQNLSTLLILGSSDIIDVVQRLRSYATLDAVTADFGTTGPEYSSAVLWFSQLPQPTQLSIGRWAKTATKGLLVGGTLSASQKDIATWNAIVNGGFKYQIDGGALTNVTGLNFAGAANLNAVAGIIQAALVGATFVYNAVYTRFEMKSNSTGVASTVAFLIAPTAGTDISSTLAMTATSSGAYRADGIGVETAVAAATLFDANFGQQWYALTIPEAVDADHLAVAALIEASGNKHLYGVSTQAAGSISAVSTTDIGYLLKQLLYKRTLWQYSSSSAYSIASLLGRALTVNYNGNQTVITLMFKQEPGIVGESLTSSQADALAAKNGNVFVNYQNNTTIVQNGVVASGDFIDTMTGTDWLATTIQTAMYNLLYTSLTRIPQTDEGTHLLVTTAESVCSQGAVNGLLGSGTWTVAGFGTLKQGDFMPKGFYVFAARVATQNAPDRAARKSVPIQIAAKLAGAVHSVNVTINVNR